MTDIPTTEPVEIIAGDTLSWSKTITDYPASDGWTLKYALVNSENKIDIETTADGDDHLVSETAATTLLYTPGTYKWVSYVENSDNDKYTIAQGTVLVSPDLSAQETGYEIRSHAKIMLDAIESILQNRATAEEIDVVSKNFKDRSVTKEPEKLMKWRTYYSNIYQQELSAERIKQGKPSGNSVRVRFSREV